MSLPDSPDSHLYRDLLREIARTELRDQRKARIMFRQLCEEDFWAYCRFASSLRDYKITDREHHHCGRLWIEHPFMFDRCRELQEDSETAADGVLYSWSRSHFKTTLITQHLMGWETLKDPTLTNCILTQKKDQTGEAMLESGIKSEFETNEMIRQHWPDVIWLDGETPDLWAATRFNVKRPPGPREPTVSVHGLDSMPTSQHFDRIYCDDLVNQKVVETEEAMEKCLRQMRRVTALRRGSGGTIIRHICTIWDENDPNMRRLRDGVYSRRSHQPAVLPAEADVRDMEHFRRAMRSKVYVPQLYTTSEIIKWRKEMGAYEFSAQCQGSPCSRGDEFFQAKWFIYYRNRPEKERLGKDIHIIIDPAGGNQGGDFTSIRVCGLGLDGNRYQLDLWRERFGLVESTNLLLGPDPGEDPDPDTWHGPKVMGPDGWMPIGIAQKWRPLCIWVESYGDNGWFDSIKEAMERKRYRVRLRKLPAIKRSKESRIVQLQPRYESGVILHPEAGFGHASKGDNRDTMHQYFNDEYIKWHPTLKRMHDDDLDSDAWFEQPEVRDKLIKFPRLPETAVQKLDPFAGRTTKDYQPKAVSFWGR